MRASACAAAGRDRRHRQDHARRQRGLDAIWRPGFHYKKAGVMLLDLARADRVQGGLFDRPDDPRRSRMRALDKLNRRFGRDTVPYAAAGVAPRLEHAARQSLAALHHHWDELLARRRYAPPTGKVLTMCGRFTQHYTWAEVHPFLCVFGPPRNLQPHYNIAPTGPWT